MTVFKRWVIRRWLGHDRGAFMNDVTTLKIKKKKEVQERSLVPSAMCGHSEKVPAMNKEGNSH